MSVVIIYWDFARIPQDQGEEVLRLYGEGLFQDLAILFVSWGVIPGTCSGCGVPLQVPGYMEYAIDNNLIPVNNEKEQTIKRANPGKEQH